MTDQPDRPNGAEPEEMSFAALLDQYSPGPETEPKVGDKIEGRIIAIGRDTVFVDARTKIDAHVDKAELLDENGALPFAVGDKLSLYVVAATESELRLSRAITGIGGLQLLQEAQAQAIPVEGRVQATCKGGFHVEVMQRRAFCPISQIDRAHVENPDAFVGEKLQFLIVRLENNGRNIVLSRRQLLERELAEGRRAFLAQLAVDQVMEGRVTRIQPFGAFVELVPGVEGMVHVSELSWSRLETAGDAVSVGDRLRVKVIRIEAVAAAAGHPKIALSVKQLGDDPWVDVARAFQEGQQVEGTVTRCAKFGVFVEVAPGIEGLVHVSEMSYTQRVTNPAAVVSAGESVTVLIKEIDPGQRRMSLSLRAALGDPWAAVNDRFAVGQLVAGRVEKKEPFGCFINLAPGITGLLPQSLIKRSPEAARLANIREGDTVAVVIESISARERKMTLAPGNPDDERNWQQFSEAPSSMSALGEKLQQALSKRGQ